MRNRVYAPMITAAAVLAAACLSFGPAFSQQGQAQGQAKGQGKGKGGGRGYQPPEGPTPRTADGKPDFSGYWQRPYTPDMSATATNMDGKPYPLEDPMHRGMPAPENPSAAGGRGGRGPRLLPFTAAYLKNWQTYDPTNGDYTGACLPFGLVRSINSPDPLQIMQNKTYFAELFEQNSWFHIVPIDGRKHLDGAPSWFGDSVGHWEGDTLVIESNNFNGRTRLDTNGHPHSDAIVVTERWTRPDLGHVQYQMKIHDPKAFTEDWKNDRQFVLRTDQEIMEYSCEENNKSLWEGRIKPPANNP